MVIPGSHVSRFYTDVRSTTRSFADGGTCRYSYPRGWTRRRFVSIAMITISTRFKINIATFFRNRLLLIWRRCLAQFI